jgi:alpha-L-fucosidase
MKRYQTTCRWLLCLSGILGLVATTRAIEDESHRDQHMAWWREARFGMFIHWGVYSVPAGIWNGNRVMQSGAEWIMNRGRIPVADYRKFATEFNPTNFNAVEWVKLAQDAGMKYIVITAKHHDGFAMYRSQASSFNIYDATPFKRDPLRELATACEQAGIKLGFYYSQAQDWNHPGGSAASSRTGQPVVDKQNHWDVAQQGSMDDYIDKIAVPQVRELLSSGHEFGTCREAATTAQTATAHHQQQPPRQGQEHRRFPDAGTTYSRHRPARRGLGNVHDDESHVGLPLV